MIRLDEKETDKEVNLSFPFLFFFCLFLFVLNELYYKMNCSQDVQVKKKISSQESKDFFYYMCTCVYVCVHVARVYVWRHLGKGLPNLLFPSVLGFLFPVYLLGNKGSDLFWLPQNTTEQPWKSKLLQISSTKSERREGKNLLCCDYKFQCSRLRSREGSQQTLTFPPGWAISIKQNSPDANTSSTWEKGTSFSTPDPSGGNFIFSLKWNALYDLWSPILWLQVQC